MCATFASPTKKGVKVSKAKQCRIIVGDDQSWPTTTRLTNGRIARDRNTSANPFSFSALPYARRMAMGPSFCSSVWKASSVHAGDEILSASISNAIIVGSLMVWTISSGCFLDVFTGLKPGNSSCELPTFQEVRLFCSRCRHVDKRWKPRGACIFPPERHLAS